MAVTDLYATRRQILCALSHAENDEEEALRTIRDGERKLEEARARIRTVMMDIAEWDSTQEED